MKNNDLEPLDFIDNYILSSFDPTNANENNNLNLYELMNEKLVPATISSSTDLLGTFSPTINNENESTILLPNNSLSVEQKFSTPKISTTLTKEFAVLNDLYEKGSLNDATQLIDNKNNEQSFQLSPIIASNTKPKQTRLANNQSQKSDLLRKTLTNNLIKSQQLSSTYKQETEVNSVKPTKLFDDEDISNNSLASCGFTTAGGKKLSFETNSLEKVKTLYEEEKIQFQKSIETTTNSSFINSGFTTAQGKKIEISQTTLAAAQKLIDNDTNVNKSQNETNDKMMNCIGFTTARGKQIDINPTALAAAKKLIDTDTNVNKSQNETNDKTINFTGFATAKGKQIEINPTALAAAKKLVDVDSDMIGLNIPNKVTEVSSGFSTAKGKSIEQNKQEDAIANKISKAKELSDLTNEQPFNEVKSKLENQTGKPKLFKKPQFLKPKFNESANDNKIKIDESTNSKDNKENLNETNINNKSAIDTSNNSLLCHYGLKLSTQERHEIELSINTLLLNESFNSTFNNSVNKEYEIENKNNIDDLHSFNIHSNLEGFDYLELIKTVENKVKKPPNLKQLLVKPIFKIYKLKSDASKNFENEEFDGK